MMYDKALGRLAPILAICAYSSLAGIAKTTNIPEFLSCSKQASHENLEILRMTYVYEIKVFAANVSRSTKRIQDPDN